MCTKIACAAIKRPKSGKVYVLPQPYRHHDIAHRMHDAGVDIAAEDIQGFVLDNGRFVDRIEAARIAMKSGQVEKMISPPNLYTEDLW